MAGSGKVAVIGGSYVDMVIRCGQFPQAGDTVRGAGFSYGITGAGPNQAVQAALCGCQVHLISKVGKDVFGQMAKDNLAEQGVNTAFVFDAEAKSTGVIFTLVNGSGENTCCVSAGANSALIKEDIICEKVEELIADVDVCLIHAELPGEAVKAAIRTANLYKTKVILDPALLIGEQKQADFPMEYYSVDVLIPNIEEAAEMIKEPTANIHTAKLIGSDLVARGVKCVIIKLGRRGCLVVDRKGADHIPAFNVDFVDHSGCSDAFAGALSASFAVGDEVRGAVKFACAAGALAGSKIGTQEALPKKEDIIELLQEQSD